MSFVHRTPFLLALLISSIVPREATTQPPTALFDPNKFRLVDKVKVEISNSLPDGADFQIHCKSGDDDLGTHVVEAGQKYGFEFKVNWWGTTLFFCGVEWHGGKTVFDVYKTARDHMRRCPHFCKWQVKDDYIFGFSEDMKLPDILIPWNLKMVEGSDVLMMKK